MASLSFIRALVLRLLISIQTEVGFQADFSVFSIVCLSVSHSERRVCESGARTPAVQCVSPFRLRDPWLVQRILLLP